MHPKTEFELQNSQSLKSRSHILEWIWGSLGAQNAQFKNQVAYPIGVQLLSLKWMLGIKTKPLMMPKTIANSV
jgi:hypothetical protein